MHAASLMPDIGARERLLSFSQRINAADYNACPWMPVMSHERGTAVSIALWDASREVGPCTQNILHRLGEEIYSASETGTVRIPFEWLECDDEDASYINSTASIMRAEFEEYVPRYAREVGEPRYARSEQPENLRQRAP